MHTNSRLLFEKYAKPHFVSQDKVLEIGPDGFPSTYQTLVADDTVIWHTLDLYDDDRLTYPRQQAEAFTVADHTYDIVLSGQVIEHVRRPWRWIQEVARVCKPGGIVITINPVSWPYHEAPIDCWRMYPEAMRAIYAEASLEVDLSLWESLELPKFAATLPGRSPEFQPRRLKWLFKLLGPLGLPTECCYDTITIGRKPMSTSCQP